MTGHATPDRVYDHAARPGPLYWDFKCLVCDGLVSNHSGLIARWWHRRKATRR